MITQNLMSVNSWLAKNRDSWQTPHFSHWSSKGRVTSIRWRGSTSSVPIKSRPRGKLSQRYSPQYIFDPMFQSMTSNSYGLFIPQPQPRSFDELHKERSYLLNSLQQENSKAIEFLRKLPLLEETLMLSQISHVRRKTRKQIDWLRYRIDETTRQEKTILNRLGQLAYEIQSRERWIQIESERRQHEQSHNNRSALCHGMEQMHFAPRGQEIQDCGHPYPNMRTPQPQQYQVGGYLWQPSIPDHTPEPLPRTQCCESIPSPNENLDTAVQLGGVETTAGMRRPVLIHRSLSMSGVDVGLMATNTHHVTVPQMKRHSTGGPCLADTWSNIKSGDEVKI